MPLMTRLSRRQLLALATTALAAPLTNAAHAARYQPTNLLRPGDFVWTPERAPQGAVVIIVSIPEQAAHVYRDGIEIGKSSCSTGKPGHRTPTGVFTILEKERKHVSSIYKGAQMPNMERLTWGGIALHAGNLPGYPASHGCIRLPNKFSQLLYEVTHLGTVVIIADEHTQPNSVIHPGALLSAVAAAEANAILAVAATRKPAAGWEPHVNYRTSAVVVSRADSRAYLAIDGRQQGAFPISIVDPKRPLGTHIYTLVGPAADGSGLNWLSFGVGKSQSESHVVTWQGDKTLRRIAFRDRARALAIADQFHAGATIVVTDAPASRLTRSTTAGLAVIASEVGL